MAEGVTLELKGPSRNVLSGAFPEWKCYIAKHFLAIVDKGHTFRRLQRQV